MKGTIQSVGWLFLCFALAGSFASATNEPLESRMEALVVQLDENGNERFEPATTAEPGNIVEYRVHFKNVGDSTLSELRVNGPVPANTHYLADSARGATAADLLVSIDGGETFEPEPVVREIRGADGELREVVIPPERYTHLRWTSHTALAPTETLTYRYRVRVNR